MTVSRRLVGAALAVSVSASLTCGSVPAAAQEVQGVPAAAEPAAAGSSDAGADPGAALSTEEIIGIVVGVLALVGVLAALGAGGVPQLKVPQLGAPQAPNGARAAGERRTVQAGGLQRSYTVVRPAGWQPGKRYPVIIGFGGWQHTAEQARGYQQLEREAGSRAIVVYAQGVDNAWAGAPYAKTSMGQDIDFVRAIIADVAAADGGDASRVAAVGLSNGGGMAAALACHAPGVVRAVASVAGAYYSPTVTGCAPGEVAALIMHGTRDDVVGYDGGTRHGARYESVPAVHDAFKRKNRCAPDGSGCARPTRLIRVEGAGHVWPGNPDATRETVQFLLGAV